MVELSRGLWQLVDHQSRKASKPFVVCVSPLSFSCPSCSSLVTSLRRRRVVMVGDKAIPAPQTHTRAQSNIPQTASHPVSQSVDRRTEGQIHRENHRQKNRQARLPFCHQQAKVALILVVVINNIACRCCRGWSRRSSSTIGAVGAGETLEFLLHAFHLVCRASDLTQSLTNSISLCAPQVKRKSLSPPYGRRKEARRAQRNLN